jgi:hypothetical protein
VSGACDRVLREMEHVVELQFARPGTATVRIHGRGDDGEGAPVPLVVERTVIIQ